MSHTNVIEKAERIARQIAQSDVAGRFWQAREKMQTHARAQELFDELKLKKNTSLILQQRLTPDHPKVMLAELDVNQIEHQLQEIPVAIQYTEAQAELNEVVQGVVQILLTRLAGTVPVELGPRQGCGKGHDGNGCDCGNQ